MTGPVPPAALRRSFDRAADDDEAGRPGSPPDVFEWWAAHGALPPVAACSTSPPAPAADDGVLVPAAVTALRTADETTPALLAWSDLHRRDLPWRRTRDPWAVLVSEVMLQQTQVARVIPKWFAFLAAYPTAPVCAGAALGDVLRLWHGLGYPRRARNLHLASRAVRELGTFPDTLDGLLALPGVGPYTARAVLAFAFERNVAVVDTNIARVIARLLGRLLTAREVQATADELVPSGGGWLWNQTIMDLGALVCRPTNPGCAVCPLQSHCAHHGVGEDPARGSAGVSSRQAPFAGSDRQARGRLLAALVAGPLRVDDVPAVMQRPPAQAAALVAALLAEGLITRRAHIIDLPTSNPPPRGSESVV